MNRTTFSLLALTCTASQLWVRGSGLHIARQPSLTGWLLVRALAQAGMMRALEAFHEAIMMVDAATDDWQILYVNSAFLSHTGALRRPAGFFFSFYSVVRVHIPGLSRCISLTTPSKSWQCAQEEQWKSSRTAQDGTLRVVRPGADLLVDTPAYCSSHPLAAGNGLRVAQ